MVGTALTDTTFKTDSRFDGLDYHALNAMLNLYDEQGHIQKPGVEGHIAVHSPDPVMFLGYWQRLDATHEKFVGDWLLTGDKGMQDEEGYIQFVGRDDDVITSSGYRIGPGPIEDGLMGHPAVAMAACIGMPHPKWDERPIVAVALKAGAQVTREELLAFYDGKLAKWQIPDDVVFVEAIPIGATGKMLKVRLREQLTTYVLPDLS